MGGNVAAVPGQLGAKATGYTCRQAVKALTHAVQSCKCTKAVTDCNPDLPPSVLHTGLQGWCRFSVSSGAAVAAAR
jgi:hypothetical protein